MRFKNIYLLIFYIVFSISYSSHAQEITYTYFYNDSIPDKIEFDVKDVVKESNYELYKIKASDQYSIYLMGGIDQYSNWAENSGTVSVLRILISSHTSNTKIGFIIDNRYAIEKNNNRMVIKNIFHLNGVGNPLLLDSDLKIKGITKFSINKEKLYFQNLDNLCEIKILNVLKDMNVRDLFNLFITSEFEVKKGNCTLMNIYQPFADWNL